MADSLTTISTEVHPPELHRPSPPHASLVLVLNRDALIEPSACLHLDGVISVAIRRSEKPRNDVHRLPTGTGGRFMCIELASPKVTKNHAEIQIRDSLLGWFVADEKSKNGTLVDGQKLVGAKANLRHGAVIEIGPYMFIFRGTRPRSLPPIEPMSVECEGNLGDPRLATFHMPLASRFFELQKIAPKAHPAQRPPRAPLPAGAGGRLMCIGLASPKVTREHAEFRDSSIGWVVKDQVSKNGTLVNGQRVLEREGLHHGTTIDIGPYMFVFQAVRARGGLPQDGDALVCEADLQPPGLATFNLGLAARFAELRKLAPSNLPILVRVLPASVRELT